MGKRHGKGRTKAEGEDDAEYPKRQKRENGEGDYPPAHVINSEAFESYYRESGVVPEEEWDAFIGTLREPLGVSFRITGHHEDPSSTSLRNYMEKAHIAHLGGLVMDDQPVPPPYPIAWYPGRMAWRFDVSRSTLRGKGALKNDDSPAARTLASFHNFLMIETELGAISRQEEVSMVPPRMLDVQPGMVVADLCAAPGSKTQQLIEAINPPNPVASMAEPPSAASASDALDGSAESKLEATLADSAGGASAVAQPKRSHGPSGLVIANDMDYRRCHLLVHQAKRLNSPALIVTNHDGTMLPTRMGLSLEGVGGAHDKTLRFDRVLCDVPCSGDGTLRKAPDLWRRWHDGLATGVHRAQMNILTRGLLMLKPGGKLVYSTCSMNPLEDEAVVSHALRELGTSQYELVDSTEELPALKRRAGRDTWRVRADGVWYETYEAVPPKVASSRKLSPSMFALPAEELRAMHIDRCMRVLPHDQDTGGFFIAVLRRIDSPTADKEEEPPEAAAEDDAAIVGPPPFPDMGGKLREGDWGCPTCKVNVFASKSACFKCGLSRADAAAAHTAAMEAVNGDAEGAAGASATQGGGGSSWPTAPGSEVGSSSTAATAPAALVSRIPSQQNLKPGPHVLAALHCSPRNNGKYDAMYTLTPAFHAELAAFFGMHASFPTDQLVSRSIGGKSVFFIGSSVRRLLTADIHSKYKLVNTGTKVLEKVDTPNGGWPFRLAQEGVHCLVEHMSPKQRLFLPTADLLDLLRRRTMPTSSFRSARFKAALTAAAPGAIAIVHDAHDTNELVAGTPLPLVLAAVRTTSNPPHVELVVKQAEALSLYNRTAHNVKGATEGVVDVMAEVQAEAKAE